MIDLLYRHLPRDLQEIAHANLPHQWNDLKVQTAWMLGCSIVGGMIGRLTVHFYSNYIRDFFNIPHAPIRSAQAESSGAVVGGFLGTHVGKLLANHILKKDHLR